MKKTITVNLNGRVFTIDEDAYRLLDNYLNNLRIYFRKEEGSSEIIADFEARIEELFSEKIRLGYQVITIEQVEEVIARVGKPDDFADREDAEEKGKEKEEKQPYFTESTESKKKFFRDVDNKMFGGVCSGIAAYFRWDVLPVRIITIILIFAMPALSGGHRFFFFAPVFAPFWTVPFLYLLAWIIFPGAHTAEQKLQMRGKPITVENIGKTVAAEKETIMPKENKGCLGGFVDLFVGLIKVFLIGLGCLVALPLSAIFIFVIILLIGLLFGFGGGLFGALPAFIIANHPILATTAFLFVLGIPVVALIYAIISHFAKLNPMNRALRLTFIIVWIAALIMMLSSGFRIDFANPKWNWNWKIFESNAIRGNGILSEKSYSLEGPVSYVEMDDHLFANLQIEQVQSDTASIVINGDENLIDQVKYDLHDGRLVLSSYKPLRSENNLVIRLQTNNLKGIRSNIAGNIQINHTFTGDELEIKMMGPGNLQADSLYVKSLTVSSEGVGSIRLSGNANKARFDVAGVGKVRAFELVSDTVYAHVEGVGSIQCNPVDYLEGSLNGVGKITYKDEPKMKNTSSSGIGKIGKE